MCILLTNRESCEDKPKREGKNEYFDTFFSCLVLRRASHLMDARESVLQIGSLSSDFLDELFVLIFNLGGL